MTVHSTPAHGPAGIGLEIIFEGNDLTGRTDSGESGVWCWHRGLTSWPVEHVASGGLCREVVAHGFVALDVRESQDVLVVGYLRHGESLNRSIGTCDVHDSGVRDWLEREARDVHGKINAVEWVDGGRCSGGELEVQARQFGGIKSVHREPGGDLKVVRGTVVQIAIVVIQGEDVDQDVLLNGTTGVQWNHVQVQVTHVEVGFVGGHPTVFECSHGVPHTARNQLAAGVDGGSARRAT